MATIDLSNYKTTLAQSLFSRAGAPTGNIFYDLANGRYEIITVEEAPVIDLTNAGTPQGTAGVVATAAVNTTSYVIASLGTTDFTLIGASANTVGIIFTATGAGTGTGTLNETTANPLSQQDGIKFEAHYAFERQERRVDENLRKFDFYFKGSFKFAGAFELVNNRKFDDAVGTGGSGTSLTTDDRFKNRGSGWIERDTAGAIGRIYYGNRSLGNIEVASAPYYQLVNGGAPTTYDKVGAIDEAIQVFGDAIVDTNTTTFDTRTFLSMKVRTFGQNYDEKQLSASGVTQMDGYASGFALGETVHLTTGTYALVDVFGGSQIAPWTGMGLEELDVAQVETGFTTPDGSFTWVVNNTGNGNLDQITAFMDALAQTDLDINDHAINTTNGQRVGVWYSYDASGNILPKVGTGAVGEGLFYEGLIGTDKNRVIFTDDAGAQKVYPAFSNVSVSVGANAVADPLAWFHAFFNDGPGAGDDFNTALAITVQDADGATLVKGNVDGTGLSVGNNIAFQFDHAGDVLGGPGAAGTDKVIVFECEGDGGVTAAKTIFTLTNAASITATCEPGVESNV